MMRRPWWTHLMVAPLALLWLVPTVILINGSLRRSTAEIASFNPVTVTGENLIQVWLQSPLLRLFVNSIVVTTSSILLVLVVAALAGFGLSFYRFHGSGVVLLLLLSSIMLAPAAIIVPLYELMVRLRLLNTYGALIGPYSAFGLAIATLFFRNAFAALPHELAESARIDGANSLQIFWHVHLPLARTTTATIVILQGLSSWNDYLMALLFMTDEKMQTVQLAYLAFQANYFSSLPRQFAVMALITIPVVVAFIALQRAFVSGLTAGALR